MTPPGTDLARGRFVTFEGPEGAGKSTQAEVLQAALEADGHRVVLVREPGGTPLGERIRALLLEAPESGAPLGPRTDALLFNAARAQLVEEVIAPALADAAIVISDRFADSTIAYQGYGAGLPADDLRALERVATAGLRPDLTILLDLPADAGLRRKTGEETRFEIAFDAVFHERVRQGFLALAASEPERVVVIDARGSQDEVAHAVRSAVDRVLSLDPESRGESSR